MRRILAVASLFVALAMPVGPVNAVTGDFVEDFEHPFVGLVVFSDANGALTLQCSGSLLTPTVFLTAGHCMVDPAMFGAPPGLSGPAASARVYFQQDAAAHLVPDPRHDPVTGYPQTCAAGTLGILCATSTEIYAYGSGFTSPDNRDAGLVILDQPIMMAEYASLATPGSLDQLATRRGLQDVRFTISGYGLSQLSPLSQTWFGERLMAESILTNLRNNIVRDFNVHTNGNGQGRGGACRGDSGGPVFHGSFSSNTIVAVTAFGLTPHCRGGDAAYRVDQEVLHDWIRVNVGEEAWNDISVRPL